MCLCLFLRSEEGIRTRGMQLKWAWYRMVEECLRGFSHTCCFVVSFLFAVSVTAFALSRPFGEVWELLLLTINLLVLFMGNERLELIREASNKANKAVTCGLPCSSSEVSSIFGSVVVQIFYGEIYYCFQPAFSSFPLLQLLN